MRATLLALALLIIADNVLAQKAPPANVVMENGVPTRIVAPEGGYVAVFLVHPGGCPELLIPAQGGGPTLVQAGRQYTLPAPRMAAQAGKATLTLVVARSLSRLPDGASAGGSIAIVGARVSACSIMSHSGSRDDVRCPGPRGRASRRSTVPRDLQLTMVTVERSSVERGRLIGRRPGAKPACGMLVHFAITGKDVPLGRTPRARLCVARGQAGNRRG